jgi:hypothetical protein
MLCPGDREIRTDTKINVTSPGGGTPSIKDVPSSGTRALNVSAEAGTTLTVTGIAESSFCGSRGLTFNSQTNNGTEVLTLRNGDTPPYFQPSTGQLPINSFLTKYIDPGTGQGKRI